MVAFGVVSVANLSSFMVRIVIVLAIQRSSATQMAAMNGCGRTQELVRGTVVATVVLCKSEDVVERFTSHLWLLLFPINATLARMV